jgi:hypothetical protein
MNDAPNGRRVHHWRGTDREEDADALADTIAVALPLFNRDGSLVRLDSAGQLVPINFAAFRKLVDKHVCGERLVQRGSGWQREYFTYQFNTPWRPDPAAAGPRLPPDEREPDETVLDRIYRSELAMRLPRAES